MPNLLAILWVDLYRNYLLPTNPASRNPIIQKLKRKVEERCDIIISYNITFDNDSLRRRIATAYLLGWTHWLLSILYSLLPNHDITSPVNISVHLFANAYPILVQLQTRNRLRKVLNKRLSKSWVDEQRWVKWDIQILRWLGKIHYTTSPPTPHPPISPSDSPPR